ncbi:CASP-like protein 4D1-like [Glycine max]|uniref:CASP-like protein n=1 Tax=Glycine max TaxID=3847 RepID=C6T5A9_SOYBN|nr:CASP-like protein 4D1-like [Glycine max]ACU16911.1 unknown [Glycine max]|eukprot:NP_001236854.1 uncharacterized protein LOC100527751 [Glycine max]
MENTTTTHSKISTFSFTVLLLRVLTFIFLVTALIFISIDTLPIETSDYAVYEEINFNYVYAYRYMLSTIVIGFAYNLLQMGFSIFTVVSGKRVLSSYGGYLFDFFGDQIISYLLISGSAAEFGYDVQRRRVTNSFTEKANVSASLLLVGFLFTATASIFTSFALPKKAIN